MSHFDEALLMPKVRQFQSGAVVEPGARRQENEGQDGEDDQVVLPSPALIRPEDGAEDAKFDLFPHPLEPTTTPRRSACGKLGFRNSVL